MTVKEIIKDYLGKNGFDGLCSENCGCGLYNLMPCGNDDALSCEPAYNHGCKGDCTGCGEPELCELIESYSTEKPEEKE